MEVMIMFQEHPWLAALFCTCCIIPLIDNRNQLGFMFMQLCCYVRVTVKRLFKRR